MADETGGSIWTRKIGPLPGWQWVAIVGGAAGIGLYFVRARRAAAADAGGGTAQTLGGAFDPAGPLPGPSTLAPIIIQQGGGSTATKPAPLLAFLTSGDWSKLQSSHRKNWVETINPTTGVKGYAPAAGKISFITAGEYRALSPSARSQFAPYTTSNGVKGYALGKALKP